MEVIGYFMQKVIERVRMALYPQYNNPEVQPCTTIAEAKARVEAIIRDGESRRG